ncbi:MAG TPA: hypothetical protein VII01_10235 [Solirubrobacteraceae bacterium]
MNEREIALSALRAAGHDQAAALVEAIIPGAAPVAAETPAVGGGLTPGQAYAQQQAVAAPQGPEPPAGKAQLHSLDEWEALPQAERIARLDEADQLYLQGRN